MRDAAEIVTFAKSVFPLMTLSYEKPYGGLRTFMQKYPFFGNATTYARKVDLARELGIIERKVILAIDRERKRRKPPK